VLEQVLDVCSKKILEVHGDSLTKLYPMTRPHELLLLVKVRRKQKLVTLHEVPIASNVAYSSVFTIPLH
jgi:hypothetical protein